MTIRHLLGSNFKTASKIIFMSIRYLICLKIIRKSRGYKTHSIRLLSNATDLSLSHLKEVYLAKIRMSTVKKILIIPVIIIMISVVFSLNIRGLSCKCCRERNQTNCSMEYFVSLNIKECQRENLEIFVLTQKHSRQCVSFSVHGW